MRITGQPCPICGAIFGGTIGTETHPDPVVREAERVARDAWSAECAALHRAHNAITAELRRLSGDAETEAALGQFLPLRRRRGRRR